MTDIDKYDDLVIVDFNTKVAPLFINELKNKRKCFSNDEWNDVLKLIKIYESNYMNLDILSKLVLLCEQYGFHDKMNGSYYKMKKCLRLKTFDV